MKYQVGLSTVPETSLSWENRRLEQVSTGSRPTAIVYVDGLNLYRRCLEASPGNKWLDIAALADLLLPDHKVVAVHYFTARVKPGASPDPRTPTRQQVYLRALDTLERVTIHFGKFRVDPRWMIAHPVSVDPDTGAYRRVQVGKVEEKGSDVNLAVRMITDAHADRADLFVALTNDSDQAGTLTVIKDELSKSTGLILPMETARASKELMKTQPDFVGFVTRAALGASQLPDRLADDHGIITRPPEWA